MGTVVFQRAIVALSGLLLFAVLSTTATAAEPRRYELPDATHAGQLGVTTDGTVWFVPRRGTEWKGDDGAILGSLAPDGTLAEHRIAGFSAIRGVAIGPGNALWVSGFRGPEYGRQTLEVGHISPTGALLQRITLGHGRGEIRSIAASGGAVWAIRAIFSPKRTLTTIERIDIASGKVQGFPRRPRCHALALDVAPDGTPWFTEKCGGYLGAGAASETSVDRIEPGGRVVRRRIAAKDYPVTLTVGPDGTVWFGAWGYYEAADRIGRLTSTGDLAEFSVPKASARSIAVGPEGRLWFPRLRRGELRALDSIGVGGDLGVPICADPECQLEPSQLTPAPDGSLWYGLKTPNYNTGGGGSGLYIQEQIENEAGFLGQLPVGSD